MNRAELKSTAEAFIRKTLRKHLQTNVGVSNGNLGKVAAHD